MNPIIVEANGARIPAIGLGTWQLRDETCVEAIQAGIAAGYRHVDTAAMYENEEAVGEGLRATRLGRDEVFVTTKVWYTEIGPGQLERSAESSLKRLGRDQVDLLLIHWPSADVPVREAVKALANAKKRGLARHIGISNFSPKRVEEAVAHCDEPLVTNQCEYHPYLNQDRVRGAGARHGLSFTSYSPLGRGDLINDAAVQDIARKHGKTAAQVILRWHVQQPGTIAIPRSSKPQRIAENFQVFDFALSVDEMRRLSGLARPDGRIVSPAWALPFDDAA
jgi:diketogulonate reductase-like aldo/keto reductase